MTESQEVQGIVDEQQIENARVGYQVATSLWSSRAGEFWSQFNAMLTANSIVLAAATVAVISQQPLLLLSLGVPFAGLALCASWLVLHTRAVGYNEYWVNSARELEEQFLNNPVRTLSRGGFFADGQTVNLLIDGKPKPLRMPWIGRMFRVRHAVRLVIAVFTVMYLAILVWALRSLS